MSADNSQVGDRYVVVLERQPAHPAGPGGVIGPRTDTGTAVALILSLVIILFQKLGHEVLGYRVAILAIVGLLCAGWILLRWTSDRGARYEPGESGVHEVIVQ